MQDQVRQRLAIRLTPRMTATPALKAGDRHYSNHLNPREADNHLREALNEYARALEQNPDSAELVCKMAKVFMRLGQDVKAEQSARKALSLSERPENERNAARIKSEAHLIIGTLAYGRDDLDAAEKAMRLSLKENPLHSAPVRFCLYKIYRNRLLKKPFSLDMLGHSVKAVYALCSSALLFPLAAERISFSNLMLLIPQLLSAWLREEMGLPEEALQRYLDLHRQFPGLPSMMLIIGEIYREKGQPEKAGYWFEKALERHPDNLNAYYHLARLREEQEDYPAMAGVYETLIRFSPNNPDLQCNLGNAYYYSGNFTDAMIHYASALQLGKDNKWKAMIAQNMGNIEADYLQNPSAAIAYYEMASVLDPEEVENYIQLGMLYFQKEDFETAEMIYRKALRYAPKHPKLHSNLGYLRWMANDVDQALAYYEQAIALDSGYEIPVNNMGVIYLDMLGQVHKAIELFQQALELDPQYALAYYNLGRAYSFLGQRLEAANCFKTAQELNHHSKELDNDELTARISQLFDTCEIELRD